MTRKWFKFSLENGPRLRLAIQELDSFAWSNEFEFPTYGISYEHAQDDWRCTVYFGPYEIMGKLF